MNSGDPEGAKEYYVYAAIEDYLRDGSFATDTPATGTLRINYGYTDEALAALADDVNQVLADDTTSGRIKAWNPELIALGSIPEYEITQHVDRD